MENRLRYTSLPGSLTIQGYVSQQRFYLIWQDGAPGLLVHQYPFILLVFYRVESSRNHSSRGSGLGLAICYNIVKTMAEKLSLQPPL
ncbi:MAG: ATP-binding protein [Candidatus Phlomobacter fragariae]